MTEAQLRSKVANWLVSYLGISEGSIKHLAIIKTFNNSGLCTRYKMTKDDSWCATSVSAAFIANGLAGKPGSNSLFECVECSCGQMVSLAKNQGIWVENDAHTPKVGDVVLYDWQDTGKGDDKAWPDHVGIVVSVSKTTFKVIEGNMKDTVGYRTMNIDGKYIRGFITPKYSKFATTEPTPTTPKVPSTDNLSKKCKFKGTVTAKSLNVRAWAGKEYKTLRYLAKGVTVEVCDIVQDKSGTDWYYIKESSKYGFVSSDYIKKNNITSPEKNSNTINKTCKFKGKVTASSLKVRSWAGTEYKALRSLAKGKVVEVCDEVKASTGKTWYYIKESGKYGFVSGEYIARI